MYSNHIYIFKFDNYPNAIKTELIVIVSLICVLIQTPNEIWERPITMSTIIQKIIIPTKHP